MNAHTNNEFTAYQRPEKLLSFDSKKKLPVIYQTEAAECGLACLAMIAGYYGHDTDLNSIRRRFPVSTRGMHLKHLVDIAGQMNMVARAVGAEINELEDLQLPCIIHWGINHFVVLRSYNKRKAVIHDPSFGERVVSSKELNANFTGIALELLPTTEFTPVKEKRLLKLSDFWSSITGLKRSLAQIIFLSLVLQVFVIASPFYMQLVIDKVIMQNNLTLIWAIASGFSILLFVQIVVSALRQYVILYLSSRLNIQMAGNLFFHLIRLPLDYFTKRHMGDIISRFGSLAQVRELLTTGLVSALIDGLMAIITLTAMFFYSVKLTLIVLVILAIYTLLRVALYQPFKQLNEEVLIASAKESSHFMESIRAIQAIKIFQRENDRQAQWQNKLADVLNKNIHISRWGIGYGSINSLLFGIENILIIFITASIVLEGYFTLGMLYAFISFKSSFIGSIDNLINQAIQFKMLDIHLHRLSDIAFADTEKATASLASHTPDPMKPAQGFASGVNSLKGKIEAKNISYRYDGTDEYVFKNISFVIQPQETVAIVGPSGCGKTTLMKCIMGLMEPSEGSILIDDVPLASFHGYRSQIASVMQDDQLISGDIAENIAFFDAHLDWEKIYKSAQMACIHEDILKMPMQYNTLIGDMGSSLSGGQKQRIVLARAFYRDPRILFMDEATSHLDVTNEALVNNHINALAITRVLVAHRPETVKCAGMQINMADFTN